MSATVDKTTDLSSFFCEVKCTALPPNLLFHPVLPYLYASKLTFPLCKTWVEQFKPPNSTIRSHKRICSQYQRPQRRSTRHSGRPVAYHSLRRQTIQVRNANYSKGISYRVKQARAGARYFRDLRIRVRTMVQSKPTNLSGLI